MGGTAASAAKYTCIDTVNRCKSMQLCPASWRQHVRHPLLVVFSNAAFASNGAPRTESQSQRLSLGVSNDASVAQLLQNTHPRSPSGLKRLILHMENRQTRTVCTCVCVRASRVNLPQPHSPHSVEKSKVQAGTPRACQTGSPWRAPSIIQQLVVQTSHPSGTC